VTEEGTPAHVVKSTGGNSPGLLVIGAGVIVAAWVLLGVLAGEWNPGTIYVVLSLIVLLSAYNVAGIKVSAGTQRAIGYFMGLAALVIVVTDLRYSAFPDDALTIIAYVVFVAGCVLMFMGARALTD
jgi:hypothetical protein